MFARSAFRAAAPLRQSIRTYASGPESKGSSFSTFATIGGVAALGGLGYTYFGGSGATMGKPEGPPKKAFVGGDQGFIPLKLEKVEDLSHNTRRIRYALPESDQVSGLEVASAVLFKHQKEGEKAVLRPYTPVSEVDEKGHLDFVIKKYPNGAMTEHLWEMKAGDETNIKGPLPKYPITPNKHETIAMICGGTGITPMYQVMRAILSNPDDKTSIRLVYGNVTEDDILLKKELNELENTYPRRFRAFYTLDKPPEGWSQGKGFITKDLLKQVLPEPKEENIKVFVCGPPGMYKAISGTKNSPQDQGELAGALKDLGYSKDQVFKF